MSDRDEIIRMAREARLLPEWLELCKKDEEALDRFVVLVRADEREACAKVCEQLGEDSGYNTGQLWGRGCANAIRARSKE